MDINAITRFAAAGILNSLLAGIAIAMLAWTVARLFSRQGSGTRFAVWFLALILIGVLPFVGHFAGTTQAATKVPAASAIMLPQSLATYLFLGWTIGATLGLLHVAHGLYRLRCLRTTCTLVDLDQLDATSRAILTELGGPPLSPVGAPSFSRFWKRVGYRHVALCTSDAVRVPAAIGYFSPMVVFPTWALSELPPAELNAILLHELAHLRRWDDFTNLAQKLVKAIFFFHPAVWFVESRLTLEREMACDDAVLAASFSPRAYAESLVDLAEKSFLRRGVQLAQAAVGHVQQLKLRLAEILRKDKLQQGSARVWKPAIALMSLVGIISFYGIAHAPRLIAFSSDMPKLSATSAPMAHAISIESDVRLQPVNLRYVEPAQATTSSAPKAQPTRTRCRHRAVLTPPINLSQRAYVARLNVNVNDTPPPRLLFSRLPVQATPSPVLLVFQGQQFGANGPIFWQVTIVHLTPAQQRAITGAIAKQI